MKLWSKDNYTNKCVEDFTVGNDRNLDMLLAEYDVTGSIAHAIMLGEMNLLSKPEVSQLTAELKNIYSEIKNNNFSISEEVEDIHSQVEFILTERLGDIGKKIHTGRSRNDQVLLDIRLFSRAEISHIARKLKNLFESLIKCSNKYKNILIPGYSHLQVAMPSSFGMWYSAYAESLADDMTLLETAYRINNQNPLGTGAGYGTSLPISRRITTELLGFENLLVNPVYAQIGRGKIERIIAQAISSAAFTLSKFAMDLSLFLCENFQFVRLPRDFSTGSSIMPHKRNPDAVELLRAYCNKLQSLPFEISLVVQNLPSGYHRDFQILKESFLPSFGLIKDCIDMATLLAENIEVNMLIINDDKYKYAFSVEEVNRRMLEGIPFRDAYHQVWELILNNSFTFDNKIITTCEGSLCNLCNDIIQKKMSDAYSGFHFEKYEIAIKKLLS